MTMPIVFVSLLTTGLPAGSEVTVALFIHPVLYTARDEAHARVVQPLAGRLGRDMLFWYAASLALAILQLLVIEQSANI